MELIPIFFGFIFFLASLVGAAIYSLKTRGRARWGGLLIVGVGMIGLLPILAVSPPLNPTLASISGTYQGDFGSYENRLVLYPNGTFDQRIADDFGKVYTNKGTWKISDIQPGSVDFKHILFPSVKEMTRPQKPELTSFGGASIHALDNAIYFNEDTDLCVKRVSNQ